MNRRLYGGDGNRDGSALRGDGVKRRIINLQGLIPIRFFGRSRGGLGFR
jgi:hypothetical protein